MNPTMDKAAFLGFLQKQPMISSHSHHLPDQDQHHLTLESMLRNSYVSWCGVPIPTKGDKEGMPSWLAAVGTRSYFVWLAKALLDLYGLEEPLTADTWNTYDQAISQAHQNKAWHLQVLKDKCGYKAIVLDTFWAPGEDNGHPALFKPAYRINSFFYGYNQEARDHNGHNIQVTHKRQIGDIDEYVEFIGQLIWEQKQAGAVALKCALAYDRSLAFGEATKEQAQRAMGEDADSVGILSFQDYIFDQVCKLAAEIHIPVQIHTGLGLMTGSNAMQLQPLIAHNPGTAFVLMHGSYPWLSDIVGLAHVYPNVWADLCWLPLISTAAAERLLHELIDVCDANRVIWGCDTWTSEESYGARLALLHVLTNVLAERVQAGLMRETDAQRYAQGVMSANASKLFRL